MNNVSFSNLSGSHFGPSLLTGLPDLLTRIRSVLGLPNPTKNQNKKDNNAKCLSSLSMLFSL